LEQDDAGEDGDRQVEEAEDDPDHRADREDPPPPRLFLASRLREGRRAACGYRGHRERKPLHIGGDAKKDIAEPERVHPAEDSVRDEQSDGHQPIMVEERSILDSER